MNWRIFTILTGIFLLACQRNQDVDTLATVEIPEAQFLVSDTTVFAGTELVIPYRASTDENIRAVALHLTGAEIVQTGSESGNTVFRLKGNYMKRAGIVSVYLIGNSITLDTIQVTIHPGEAQNLLETYAGPHTIRTGNDERAMVAAVPRDVFGNLSINAEPVMFTISGLQNEPLVNYSIPLNGVAYVDLFSRDLTGKIVVGAKAGISSSLQEMVEIVPSEAQAFQLSSSPGVKLADGRSITQLQTGEITDRYGNIISDGSLVRYYFSEDGQPISTYESITIGGISRLHYQHPERMSTLSVQAVTGMNAVSNSITLEYEQEIRSLDVKYDAAKKLLKVGPLSGSTGSYLADGIRIDLQLVNNQVQNWHTGFLEQGYCYFDLSEMLLTPGSYTAMIHAAGMKRELTIQYNR